MNEIVSHVDSIENDVLDTIILKPRFSVLVIDLVVSPEEGIEHAQLVHHDPEIFRRLELVAWDVCSTEGMSSDSQ